MSNVLRLGIFAFLGLLLTACASSHRVSTDYNPEFDFQGKTRLAVVRPGMALRAAGVNATIEAVDDLLANRLISSIEANLLAKGYEIVDIDSAELIVTFFVTAQNKTELRTYNTGLHYTCWDPVFCSPVSTQEVRAVNYDEGSLFIDFIEPVADRLEWRGISSKRLPKTEVDPAKRDTFVKEFVDSILDQYPPDLGR